MTARSFSEIFQTALTDKTNLPELAALQTNVSNEQTFLNELTSNSKVARWVHYLYLVCRSIWTFEQLLAAEVAEVTKIRDEASSGNSRWLIYNVKKFQYGDNIIVDETTNFIPAYATIDTDKQIIKNASLSVVNGKILLKIQGRDSNILDANQLTAFNSFIRDIKWPEQRILIQNIEPDSIKILGNVRYNGNFNISTVKSQVESAITEYINNISFDANFVRNSLIDSVQAVSGVNDFEINTLETKSAISETYVPIIHRITSVAGYYSIDVDYPLAQYITYTAI